MGLAEDYQRQLAWRDWQRALDTLPALAGQTVLDLGCGVGDQTGLLLARGAQVLGLDLNPELLAVAQARYPQARFQLANLHGLSELPAAFAQADGIWSSFTAAYFPDFLPTLQVWKQALRPGGWIALTEMADLFLHQPLQPETEAWLARYTAQAFAAGRYDFAMGQKLGVYLEQAGFQLQQQLLLNDQELSFQGPALPEVLQAWEARLERMPLLKTLGGDDFARLKADFLSCLAQPDHSSGARVYFYLAKKI